MVIQEFRDNLPVEMSSHDFSGSEEALQNAKDYMQAEFVKPFGLYDAPLFKFELIKVSDSCYLWFQKYHHLITDGWGISLIVQRVARAYNEIIEGISKRAFFSL